MIDSIKIRYDYKYNKLKVYRLLGNSCSCCGLSEISCLQLDHVNNTEKDRFQLLCGNCHNSKTQLGKCYHSI